MREQQLIRTISGTVAMAAIGAALALSATTARAGEIYLKGGLPGVMLGYAHPLNSYFGLRLDAATIGTVSERRTEDGIAYDVHLFGIAFAAMYFFLRWNFSWVQSPADLWYAFRRRLLGPRLKVVRSSEFDRERRDALEADRILAKIHESGKDSLTTKEKRFMERYSQAIRDKNKSES